MDRKRKRFETTYSSMSKNYLCTEWGGVRK